MMPYELFVVDDEDVAREGISLALRNLYRVHSYASAENALADLPRVMPDLILLDVGLPGISGIDALERILVTKPDTLVIMITAFEDVQTVVSAMKLGAYDYLAKPLDMDGLMISVRNALETIALKKEIQLLQKKYIQENQPLIIGESTQMKDILNVVSVVAQSTDTPVIILGETGTGKELIAKTIHCQSPNFRGPLVPVNCAAVPKELIESELFGYEKGAFSGADKNGKTGLVEESADGTLFLDEVADLSAEAQAKLLRFLESGEFFRVGGTQSRHVKTRIVSATNKNLDKLMEQGSFRRDLFFRLAVVKINVPSLNERRQDIIPIARHLLMQYNQKFRKSFTGLTPQAERALIDHHWTGNIRELKNLIEHGVLLGSGKQLDVSHLGIGQPAPALSAGPQDCGARHLPELTLDGMDINLIIETIQKEYFESALAMAGGNESKAARLLNMSRDKFRYRRKINRKARVS
jgi:DNA-binding NtrC family response regulator